MRAEDRAELYAGCGLNAFDGLVESWRVSEQYRRTVLVARRPEAMFGVSLGTVLSGLGIVWLLGTEDFPKLCRRELLTVPPRILLEMSRICPHLGNVVDARQRRSIAWLKRIGAQVTEHTVAVGPFWMPFHQFTITNGDRPCATP